MHQSAYFSDDQDSQMPFFHRLFKAQHHPDSFRNVLVASMYRIIQKEMSPACLAASFDNSRKGQIFMEMLNSPSVWGVLILKNSNLSNFDKVYREKHKYLLYQINIIRFVMKYFSFDLFSILGVACILLQIWSNKENFNFWKINSPYILK